MEIGETMYTCSEDTLYVHQYMESSAQYDGMTISQTTAYPSDGKIKVSYSGNRRYVALRIPCRCTEFTLNKPYTINNGYAVIEAEGGDIELELAMPVHMVRANNAVHECAGRVAVMRGPVVYCAEAVDNGTDIANLCIDVRGSFETEDSSFGLPVIKTTGYMQKSTDCLYARADDNYSAVPVTLIPYYAFANRGETEMNVWLLRK